MTQSVLSGSGPGTDEQFAAREMVRDWAAASGAPAGAPAVGQGGAAGRRRGG